MEGKQVSKQIRKAQMAIISVSFIVILKTDVCENTLVDFLNILVMFSSG